MKRHATGFGTGGVFFLDHQNAARKLRPGKEGENPAQAWFRLGTRKNARAFPFGSLSFTAIAAGILNVFEI